MKSEKEDAHKIPEKLSPTQFVFGVLQIRLCVLVSFAHLLVLLLQFGVLLVKLLNAFLENEIKHGRLLPLGLGN